MKKQYFLFALPLLFIGLLSSCKEDIDLENIDGKAEVEMGFAVPMGTMTATLGDFLGNGQVDGIYVGDDHLLYFRDTFDVSRKFHDVDLKSKITDFGPKHFNVYDKLKEMGYLDPVGKVTVEGTPITLDFPFWMKLKDINNDVSDERLDSALILNANFTSLIGQTNLDDLQESWVDKVEIELGNEFHRPAGKNVLVCGPGTFRYETPVPIPIDNFVLDLMTKHNETDWKNYPKNVKDSCQMHIKFTFTIPVGSGVTIKSNATYDYSLNVQFVKYEAIWGFFRPSAEMRDASNIVLEEEWAHWAHFKKATLTFHDPKVNVLIDHAITGVMNMHGEYLYAKNLTTNDSVYAYFDPARTQVKRYQSYNRPGEYLLLTSPIGDSIHNQMLFDKDTYRGQIDKMFVIRPDILAYKFFIDFDSVTTPQIRILPDTRIKVRGDLWAPFSFNEGVEASYVDTTKDANLSKYSLDSLAATTSFIDTIKTSNVKLVLHVQNRIPMTMRGVVYFYDKDMNVVMDPNDPKKPLRISNIDTLHIPAPQYTFSAGISSISAPGEDVYTLDLQKKHFDTLAKIKHIRYFVELDGKDLHDEYKADPNFLIRLNADDQLKMQIGLTTDLDAVLNFNKKDDKKK